MRALSFIPLLLFASCSGLYEKGFDCPVNRGIGCVSVIEVEDMILPKEDGYVFLGDDEDCKQCKGKNEQFQVWINEKAMEKIEASGV